MEIGLAILAADAYRRAKHHFRESLGGVQPQPLVDAPEGVLPRVPLAVAGLCLTGYLGLVLIGIFAPDYSSIDRAGEHFSETKDTKSYVHLAHGVEMRIPKDWEWDKEDKTVFVQAKFLDGACNVSLMAEADIFFRSADDFAYELANQILKDNSNFALERRWPSELSKLRGRELLFAADIEGSRVLQNYIVVRKGLSQYVFVSTVLDEVSDSCDGPVEYIRKSVVIR